MENLGTLLLAVGSLSRKISNHALDLRPDLDLARDLFNKMLSTGQNCLGESF